MKCHKLWATVTLQPFGGAAYNVSVLRQERSWGVFTAKRVAQRKVLLGEWCNVDGEYCLKSLWYLLMALHVSGDLHTCSGVFFGIITVIFRSV